MLKILLLICPAALDHAACDQHNAIDVVRAFRVPSAQQCGFLGEAMLAPTTLVPAPKDGYLKIVCLREAAN